jgi:hypothetical protein
LAKASAISLWKSQRKNLAAFCTDDDSHEWRASVAYYGIVYIADFDLDNWAIVFVDHFFNAFRQRMKA